MNNIVGIGVDIESIDRFRKHSKNRDSRFLQKIYTFSELSYCFSKKDPSFHLVARFAESEGFKVLLLKSIGGSPEILADIFAKHLLYIPVIGKFLSNGIQSMALFFIKTRLGKKISEKSSHNFSLGYFMVVEK